MKLLVLVFNSQKKKHELKLLLVSSNEVSSNEARNAGKIDEDHHDISLSVGYLQEIILIVKSY